MANLLVGSKLMQPTEGEEYFEEVNGRYVLFMLKEKILHQASGKTKEEAREELYG